MALTAAQASKELLGASAKGLISPRAFDSIKPNFRSYAESQRLIFQLVDKNTGEPVIRHEVIGHVLQLQATPEVRASLSYTAGGAHLDMPQRSAQGFVRFVIRIDSGVWPQGRASGAPDGMAGVWALQGLINAYLDNEINGRPRADFDLEFINTDAPVSGQDPAGIAHFVIAPDRTAPSLSREARKASTWSLSFSFTGFERRDGRRAELLRKKARERSFFEKILDAIATLQQYSFDTMFQRYQSAISPFTRALAAVTDVRLFLEDWSRGIDTFLNFNLGLLSSLMGDIGAIGLTVSAELGVNQVDRFGADGSIMRSFEQMGRTLSRTQDAIAANFEGTSSPLAAGGDLVGATARSQTPQPSPLQEQQDARHLSLPDRDRQQPLASVQAAGRLGTVQLAVGDGMTLSNFVPSGFTIFDVIRLNGLEYPFVDGRTRPDGDTSRVRYLGELVTVPVPRGTASVTARGAAPGSNDDPDERIFGTDWAVIDREVVFDETTGDLRMVRGLPNLLQALRARLSIPVGFLNYAPDLGTLLHREVEGTWGTPQSLRLASIAAYNTLRSDPRVAQVTSLKVSASGGVVDVAFELDTIDGAPRGRQSLSA